eukprot:EG_transcript_17362
MDWQWMLNVVCFQGQCLYVGLPYVHFCLELLAASYCIYELHLLFGEQLQLRGRLRRQLFIILLLNSLVKLTRDSFNIFHWYLGLPAIYIISLVPMTSLIADFVMVSYWSQVFYREHSGTISRGATAIIALVQGANAFLCLLRMRGEVSPQALLLLWGFSLGLMSVVHVGFVASVSGGLKEMEHILGEERCRPLRWSLFLSALVAVCYIVRSAVYCCAAVKMPIVFWMVGNPEWNTLYTVCFVFFPSWLTMATFSSHMLNVEQSSPAEKSTVP